MKREKEGSKDARVRSLLGSGEKKIRERKPKDAVADLLEAAELDPENPEVHYRLGIAYVKMERYEEAVHHLVKLVSSELSYINRVHARMILGYVYTLKGDYVKALEHLRWIVKAGFNSAQAYAAIGYIMDRLGNFKEAVMNLYRAVEIDPDNANAHNSLGYIYAEAGVNLDQALVECRKAVGLDENNPAYLDSLGWVYYKLGKHSQAKSYLTRALKKSPGSEEVMRHLTRVMNEMPAVPKRPIDEMPAVPKRPSGVVKATVTKNPPGVVKATVTKDPPGVVKHTGPKPPQGEGTSAGPKRPSGKVKPPAPKKPPKTSRPGSPRPNR